MATESVPPHALSLPSGILLAEGRRIIDVAVNRLAGLADGEPGAWPDLTELADRLGGPPPERPTALAEALDLLEHTVWPARIHHDHPRCFAFVPGASNDVGMLGAILATAVNACSGNTFVAAGPTLVDAVTVGWLVELLGLPSTFGGVFTSGGSMANLTALTVARDHGLGDNLAQAMAYCSDQTHPTVARVLHIAGMRRSQLAVLPSQKGRLNPQALARRMAADISAGKRPFLVVANGGTTATGAVDPLGHIADVCQQHNVWLHIDGAFGAAAALTERGRLIFDGLHHADSITVDPHKWLFQPFGLGCVLLREPRLLDRTFGLRNFTLDSSYLSAAQQHGLMNPEGVELTREFRGLRLWLTLKVFGAAAVRAAIDHSLDLAEHASRIVCQLPELELIAHNLAVVCLRYKPRGRIGQTLDSHNEALVAQLRQDGHALVLTALVDGSVVIRLCMTNPRTTHQDIETTLARIVDVGRQPSTAHGDST